MKSAWTFEMMATKEIAAVRELMGRQFHTISTVPCWTFCQVVLREMGKKIPQSLAVMARIEEPRIGAVVLFRQKKGFHAGVVWPDCLHFVHARVPLNQPSHPPAGREDRLSDPLYELLIDGYYVYE